MQNEHYFDVVVRLEPRIRKMLKRVCPSVAVADEAWSDVILERAERVVELWDPDKGASLDGYFLRTMRWYTQKWLVRRVRFISGRVPRGTSVSYDNSPTDLPTDDLVEINMLLEKLTPFDQWVIRRHALEGYTFKELRIILGVSKSAVRCFYNRAIRKLKEMV